MSIKQKQVQYRNKSIDSLVEQLANLGNRSILTHQTQLICIQMGQTQQIRRFQTKSTPIRQFLKLSNNDKKYFYDQIIANRLEQQNIRQFIQNFTQKQHNCSIFLQNNQKNLKQLLILLQQSLLNNNIVTFCSLINSKNQVYDVFGQHKIQYKELINNRKYYQVKNVKEIMQYLDQLYEEKSVSSCGCNNNQSNSFLTLTFKNLNTYAEFNILLAPSQLLYPNNNNNNDQSQQSQILVSLLNLIRSQLFQILNYIKMHPQKRYSHISNLITKRHPITNYLTKILMNDTSNLIINYIQNNNTKIQQKKINMTGKFQFFDKLKLIMNILRKPDRYTIQIGIKKQLISTKRNKINNNKNNNNNKKIYYNQQQYSKTITKSKSLIQSHNHDPNNQLQKHYSPINKIINKNKTEQQALNQHQYIKTNQQIQKKQFQFCRELQRKTHKYSVSPHQQDKIVLNNNRKDYNINLQKQLDKKTISKYDLNLQKSLLHAQQLKTTSLLQTIIDQNHLSPANTQSQQIHLLKAQHTRQISQYHQTIQNLNKKIFILTKQLNLQQLYQIHQRQIMLLQLKIKQLRNDIILLTSIQKNQKYQNNEENHQKSLKQIIKRLNQQINKNNQSNSSNINKKVSQGKMIMLQKQLKQIKQKLNNSQKARSLLTLQVQSLTKRLKIRDTQIQKINNQQIQKFKQQSNEQLSVTEEQLLQIIKKLIKAVKNQQRNSEEYLIRKISLILSDLSKSRDIILECNDFLVQLMEVLDVKLSNKQPEILLDCNKFIRTFLIQNLSIF